MLTAESLIDSSFKKWDKANKKLIELIKQMPEDKLDFKPTDASFSFKDLILHIYQGEKVLAQGVLKGTLRIKDFTGYVFPECSTKKDLIKHAEETHRFTNDNFSKRTVEELSKEVETEWGNRPTFSLLISSYDHLCHHRGQIYFYLRLAGVDNPVPVDE